MSQALACSGELVPAWAKHAIPSPDIGRGCYVHRVLDMESGVFLDTESMEFLGTSSGLRL